MIAGRLVRADGGRHLVSAPHLAANGRLRRVIVGLGIPASIAWLILAAIVLAAIVGPALWSRDAFSQDLLVRLSEPSLAYPLGVDPLGRDIFARVLLGARWSLAGAAVVCLGVNSLGFLIGALGALGPKTLDTVLGRLVELLMALPWLVTALALTSVLGPSFVNLCLSLIVTSWPWYARTYRTLVLRERAMLYVEASRAIGASPLRIAGRHILPNVLGPAIVLITANLGSVILSLTSFSFLGLGTQPPTPEWGMMINEARTFFQRQPWQMIAPGMCIVVTALAVNIAGDGLRDLLDPRTR